MAEHEINMKEHWQEIQSELDSRGFIIYPNSILSTEGQAPWPTKEGITKFLDLAENLERKVIYIDTYKFDSEDAIDLLLLTAPEDLVDYEVETVKDCLRSLGVETSEEAKDYLKITNRSAMRADGVFWVKHRGCLPSNFPHIQARPASCRMMRPRRCR